MNFHRATVIGAPAVVQVQATLRRRILRAFAGAHWALECIAVLVVRERNGQTADFRLQKIDASHITEVLRPLLGKDPIHCMDGASVYPMVARTLGLAHRAIKV